jgi:tetratricopeptide (TPR) repeat protein
MIAVMLRASAAAVLLAALLGGCSEYRRFDSAEHLRQQYARHAGPLAGELVVPFELSAELRGQVEAPRAQATELRRINRVLDFIFHQLDLRYQLAPTHTAEETFRTQRGNCLSFVNLFVGVARENGLNPFYVEVTDYQGWSHRNGMVVSQGHIVAGMYLDGELKTYDFLPYRPKAYKEFQPIDDLAAATHYYNNLGAEELLAGNFPRARELLTIASLLSPGSPRALNNLGVLSAREGRTAEAFDTYQRALAIDPLNSMVMTNLARLHQQRGEAARADELLAQVEAANTTNPFFFIYQADVALARGDHRKALDYMSRALRLDTESAEVHVGLVRVFMALGEMEKVRHHLGRALKLDATNEQALRYARMVGG